MRRRAAAGSGGERGRVAQRVRALLADPFGSPGGTDWTASADDARLGVNSDVGADADPAGRPSASRFRFDPGRRGAAMVGAAAVVAAVVTGVWVFSSRPQHVPVSGSGLASASANTVSGPSGSALPTSATSSPGAVDAAPSTSKSAASASASGTALVVDVAGKVRHPGLYSLPTGSRIDDAVQAAGGALSGVSLTSLNLASKLTDGQQILVGLPPTAGAADGSVPGPGSAGSVAATGPVNLNTASLEQLETLPGIGPALGQRILDWRAAHGSFASVSQLNEVSGIGDVRMTQLRPLVSV